MKSLKFVELLVDGQLCSPSSTASCDPSGPEAHRLVCGLFTILASYGYDYRLTEGEGNVESSWTICTLTPLLSWLDDELVPQEALVHTAATADDHMALKHAAQEPTVQPKVNERMQTAVVMWLRRVLVYAYLRRWDLAQLCLNDAISIMMCGKRQVLRALLRVRDVLAHDEQRYLLNTLFINDFCSWVMSLTDNFFSEAALLLTPCIAAIRKDSQYLMELGLLELESANDTEER